MRRRIVGGTVVIMIVVLACLEIPIGLLLSGAHREAFEARVRADAYALALSVSSAPDAASVGPRAQVVRLGADARVVVVDRDGRVQFDSDPIATDGTTGRGGIGRDFSSRSEIRGALQGREQVLSRESKTLGTSLFIVAVPVVRAGRADGVVRVSTPSSDVDATVRTTWLILVSLALGVLSIVVPVAWVWSGRVSAPLQHLSEQFGALGAGDLSARARVPRDPAELRELAQNFNALAARLEQSAMSSVEPGTDDEQAL